MYSTKGWGNKLNLSTENTDVYLSDIDSLKQKIKSEKIYFFERDLNKELISAINHELNVPYRVFDVISINYICYKGYIMCYEPEKLHVIKEKDTIVKNVISIIQNIDELKVASKFMPKDDYELCYDKLDYLVNGKFKTEIVNGILEDKKFKQFLIRNQDYSSEDMKKNFHTKDEFENLLFKSINVNNDLDTKTNVRVIKMSIFKTCDILHENFYKKDKYKFSKDKTVRQRQENIIDQKMFCFFKRNNFFKVITSNGDGFVDKNLKSD